MSSYSRCESSVVLRMLLRVPEMSRSSRLRLRSRAGRAPFIGFWLSRVEQKQSLRESVQQRKPYHFVVKCHQCEVITDPVRKQTRKEEPQLKKKARFPSPTLPAHPSFPARSVEPLPPPAANRIKPLDTRGAFIHVVSPCFRCVSSVTLRRLAGHAPDSTSVATRGTRMGLTP